ncbi:hypothetical protein [Stenotrophomonas nitritireducens]|uniref:hypothetical protein n=1 Tax=Stenotrophomonas nitritireducens TaxID=83617 RepID=UPI00235575E9|nr:hypothetical protein [Stenotrophomonas nitritireducens]
MRWEVQIAGSKTDLDDLCAVFTSDALRLESRSDGYFLSSTQLESIDSPREVEARASELASLLSGASRLSLGSRTSLKTSGCISTDAFGKRTHHMFLSDTIYLSARATMEVQHTDGAVTRFLPASPAPAWVTAALSDSAVAKAIRLFGAGAEPWVDLYRILEVIMQDVGGIESIASRGWVTKSKIELFKRTANSVTATGDESRHGAERTIPPKDPMMLSEAKSIISILLHSWLQEKASGSASRT